MNFVEQYYKFKQKWYFKLGTLLFDFYLCKEINTQVNKIKYQYLEDIIKSYIENNIIEENEIKDILETINYQALNKLEFELLKHVVYISKDYSDIKFNETDYIYFALLLELIISMYNTTFIGLNQQLVNGILKENLFRFEFIDFKNKQSKKNILIRYLQYIYKYNDMYFKNLKNKNIDINITSLSNHRGYYIIDIKNKLSELNRYDPELIETVEKSNDYLNKLFILNFNILIQQLVLLLEKDRYSVNKVIFNLDNYNFTRKAINYLNNCGPIITRYIMLNSSNKKKLDIISNKYDKCIYVNNAEGHNLKEYDDINILINKSYWITHKKNTKRLEGLKFITINDNISYKFDKEEK